MSITLVISTFATISWLVVVILLALLVVRAVRRQSTKGVMSAFVIAAVAALLITTISAGLVFVEPQERAVVISAFAAKGYRDEPLQPGLNWIIPYAESVVYYPISKQTYTMSIAHAEGQVQGDDSVAARTSDGQEIFIDASVIFKIDPNKVVDVHITWQDRYADDLVRPMARGIIRDAISQYRVDEVVSTERFVIVEQISEELGKQLADNGLILDDFVLRNITFSAEYAQSVEQKQIAEQQAQQAKFVVEQKKQEAEQARQVAQGQADAAVIAAEGDAKARLIQAEAEAKALQMIADVLAQNPDLLTYNYIEKLAPGIQVMLVPSDNPYILPLPSLEDNGYNTAPETVIPTPTAPVTNTTP